MPGRIGKTTRWPAGLGTPATFSWVEPTSWCILALKKAAPDPTARETADRVIEAERMLADRCCLEGGWNYGNSNVLGKELHPMSRARRWRSSRCRIAVRCPR